MKEFSSWCLDRWVTLCNLKRGSKDSVAAVLESDKVKGLFLRGNLESGDVVSSEPSEKFVSFCDKMVRDGKTDVF